MNSGEILQIEDAFDVIGARMQVREVARAQGFSTVDQSRISLAASSLANAMKLGHIRLGEITIDCLSNGGRTGVRVICTAANVTAEDFPEGAFRDTRWMVDEFTMEELPCNELRITVIKWHSNKRPRAQLETLKVTR